MVALGVAIANRSAASRIAHILGPGREANWLFVANGATLYCLR
jgi:hypothetical protein